MRRFSVANSIVKDKEDDEGRERKSVLPIALLRIDFNYFHGRLQTADLRSAFLVRLARLDIPLLGELLLVSQDCYL